MKQSLVVRLLFIRVVQQDRQLDLLVQALDHAIQPKTQVSLGNTPRLHQQVPEWEQILPIATFQIQEPVHRQNDPGTIAVMNTMIPKTQVVEGKHFQCQLCLQLGIHRPDRTSHRRSRTPTTVLCLIVLKHEERLVPHHCKCL